MCCSWKVGQTMNLKYRNTLIDLLTDLLIDLLTDCIDLLHYFKTWKRYAMQHIMGNVNHSQWDFIFVLERGSDIGVGRKMLPDIYSSAPLAVNCH